MIELSELQHDALVEIFNIGVGHAAAAMSTMVNEEVALTVPTITFATRAEAARQLGEQANDRICGVSQNYRGSFNTEAILMFPEHKSLELVSLMVGDHIPLQELTEMEQEAMGEIGNIILNACIGTLADMFESQLEGSLPVYRVGTCEDVLNVSGSDADAPTLMLHIDFIVEKHAISGYVAFLLDLAALQDLRDQLDAYLEKALG
ncbi:MAG: chemotaxis protein CheC [Aquabacterium sp.]|uniref:chemotaxis protein CheC n=1 Tax=Aquabacterium sp. TaxID=1872578 RepID=UPI003BE71D32